MKVVVTGGAGFLGSHLTRALLSAGCEVIVVDDLSTGAVSNLSGLPVKLVVGSVTDRALLEEAAAGADSIVHLAARPSVERSLLDPMASHDVNVTGTLTVLDVAQRAEAHVIVTSSASVYGDAGSLPCREDGPVAPRSPYAASKLAAEAYALGFSASFSLPVLVARLFTVFGPFQSVGHAYAAVIPSFIDAALSGRPLTVHGDGRQTRDVGYVEPIAAMLAEATTRRLAHPRPVNLAFGAQVDLLTLVAQLEEILGYQLPVAFGPRRAGDVRDLRADPTTALALFPRAKEVDLATALDATVAWYAARGGHPLGIQEPPPVRGRA
ncbi:NAD-dependent epimerase/dehydratase family protein [Frankia sp. CNm7]|uniref:NAD-dependent epimerase/dehydratase family protein n=1 Tax=Frankia nepalensis TaxID=1836974 RepID=A0A937RI65_9ACTN|nr:NAD-dependent epimerase/dehydratase family protein [Frankia nepalensis]MBL7495555.1 NAD-dependent epimerase/dehydratase family protein [Frankia nepalensis]MBL7509836.1 NAD-dependent epimerase/dehydratase family protein [Frankia nepalensis]MBL7517499.1 NAD-dependent epimerase/dehydratase family protein [Frankia nepalensis]MBL7626828.1 NAD-dependent epimerase/dehydratase family protein [Frankia nepalensis]